jgi:tetratricopeptide (TPR) repeat protein
MNGTAPYPGYIRRVQEEEVGDELTAVRGDGQSRAILLSGPGGVGKTWLVRQLSRTRADPNTIWLDPIDIDDPESWLLSNLESRVARRLDPENNYFGPYHRQVSGLPVYTNTPISHETIVRHLTLSKEEFARCYQQFVARADKTVVITFDTVETIRGTSQLLALTQWMKALPSATLFILSCRPVVHRDEGQADPIITELASPHQGISVRTIELGEFTIEAAHSFLDHALAGDLSADERNKIVLLTRGHPLWLAFTVDYLGDHPIPLEVADNSLTVIEASVPYGESMTIAGMQLHEGFLRRLVAPYQESDFWHEAIKRLAVVRQSIAKPVWLQLMDDCPLPEGTESLEDAWELLLATPWVRPRGNRHFVTLHDAVAEELALRLFPLHDQNQEWRGALWQRALGIYRELATLAAAEYVTERSALDEDLAGLRERQPGMAAPAGLTGSEVVANTLRLAGMKRQLDLLRAASLYYLFLCDFEAGCQQLLAYFEDADEQHDLPFLDLLALYMQRFLPGGTYSSAFNDVISIKLDEFRDWLENRSPGYYLTFGLLLANYLIQDARPIPALDLLRRLPDRVADSQQRHRLSILKGNACLRIPGRVAEGRRYFDEAIRDAESLASGDSHKLIAQAYNELGFYYRNTGEWRKADEAYKRARRTISEILSTDSPPEDRDEMASIQTNWAYVKGLEGSYREGAELVESAIAVRRRLLRPEEGISWSVCGEVYRYARRFEKAWSAYAEAEALFQVSRYGHWLGFVYQEQAICLYQALEDDIKLTDDPIGDAKDLIEKALDICLRHNIRGYPSALNRAGRIFGDEDVEAGRRYLTSGINEAHLLADGWFWFANMVEFAELSYRAWRETGLDQYREDILALRPAIQEATTDYSFPDLTGRWMLLQGHLGVHEYLETNDRGALDSALSNYILGFASIAERHVGSSGAAAIPGEFRAFRGIFSQLPEQTQADWQARLRRAWTALEDGSTLLLARLEELY